MLHDLPLPHDHKLVGETNRFLNIVRDEQDSLTDQTLDSQQFVL